MVPTPPRPPPLPTVARIIWLALLGGASIFLVVVALVRRSNPDIGNPSLGLLVWVALAVALAGLAASRAVARRPAPATGSQALARMITQLTLSDLGALFGGVAWLVTGDAWSLAAAAIGLLGLALAYPRSGSLEGAGQGPRRMIR